MEQGRAILERQPRAACSQGLSPLKAAVGGWGEGSPVHAQEGTVYPSLGLFLPLTFLLRNSEGQTVTFAEFEVPGTWMWTPR